VWRPYFFGFSPRWLTYSHFGHLQELWLGSVFRCFTHLIEETLHGFSSSPVPLWLPEFFERPVLPHNAVWDFTGEEIGAFWNFIALGDTPCGSQAAGKLRIELKKVELAHAHSR
jgi:hypothetical protein